MQDFVLEVSPPPSPYAFGEQMQHTNAAHKCSTQMQHTHAAYKCSTQMQHTNAAHKCSTQMQHTNAAHKCSTQMQHTNAAHKCFWCGELVGGYDCCCQRNSLLTEVFATNIMNCYVYNDQLLIYCIQLSRT